MQISPEKELSKMLLRSVRYCLQKRHCAVYKSASSSSGRGIWAASFISCWYWASNSASTVAVGGARAGAATNSYTTIRKDTTGGLTKTYQSGVSDQLSGQPEERLLKVVVGLGRDIIVLQVLLAVEGDCLGLDLSLLDINLVAGEDDGDVLADTDQVT